MFTLIPCVHCLDIIKDKLKRLSVIYLQRNSQISPRLGESCAFTIEFLVMQLVTYK